MPTRPSYDTNVFINCPFDDAYKAMFEAIVFAVMDCGFTPRCALEVSDSIQPRIDKILGLVRDCRLAVHDISNTELDGANGLPRFNMPFELGLFVGMARSGTAKQRRKSCVVLDKEAYRYQRFLSDISGQDIASHDGNAETLVGKIRDWLQSHADLPLPGGSLINTRYQQFRLALPAICADLRLKETELTFQDLGATIAMFLTTP